MSRTEKTWLAALLLLAALFLPAAGAADLLSGDALTGESVNYRTETVQLGVYEKTANASASLYYPMTLSVSYDYGQARFVEYAVARGDAVKAGDVLARLRVTASAAEMARMELSLERAREAMVRALEAYDARIAGASAAAEAAEGLAREEKALALRRLQVERAQYVNRQEYDLENQSLALEEARAALTMDVLRAPADGVVTDLASHKADDPIAAGETMVTLQASEEVVLLRLDNRAGSFRYNMPVTVRVGTLGNGKALTGRVVASEEAVPQGRRSGFAYVRLDPGQDDVGLKNLQVSGPEIRVEDVLLVTRRAVSQDQGQYTVSKLSDGVVQKRLVTVGHANSTHMWILQGVSEGETLILN